MSPTAFRRLLPGVLVITILATVLPAAAQPPVAEPDSTAAMAVLEQLVATVDDEAILLGELIADLQYFAMQTGQMPPRAAQERLLNEALENRIQEKLLIAKARRDEVQVGEEDLDLAMDRHIERLKDQAGGEARFTQQLVAEGLSERDLRRDLEPALRDQILAQRVVERISFGLVVDDAELRAYYDMHRDDPERIPLRPRAAELSHIVVMPKAAPEREAALQAKLADIDARLAAGEEFADIARDVSEGPAATRGGDLGWWKLEDIALPELAFGLTNLSAGDRSRIRSEQGHHVVEMLERENQRVHFQQIFLPSPIDDTDRQVARDRAREAWKALQAGGDWAAVVREYSDDEPTLEDGGRLPAIPEEQLDERYRDVVDVLEPGEYSGVFLGKHGYQILRLEGREQARPFEFEEIAEQLRADVLGRKRGEIIQDYIQGLEAEIIVKRHEIPSLERIAALAGGTAGQAP